MSLHLSACVSADATGQISVNFDIGDFYENVEKIQIWLESNKNSGHLTWRPKCVLYCLQRHLQHNNKCNVLLCFCINMNFLSNCLGYEK